MLDALKRDIVIALDKLELKDDDTATLEAVRNTVRVAVATTVEETSQQTSLEEIAQEAVTASVEQLGKTSAVNERHLAAAIQGVMDGTISQKERDDIEKAWDELWVAKVRLRRRREALADRMREILAGAEHSTGQFSGTARKRLITAIEETKRKHEEVLGLTHENVRNAVDQVLQSGKDVEPQVRRTAREATEKALLYTRLSAERVNRVTHAVLSAAVDGAAKTGSRVEDVAREARQGVYEGVNQAMETAKKAVTDAGERTTSYLKADLARTQEDLKALEKTLVETVKKAASNSTALIEQTRETAKSLKDRAKDASGTVTERVTELSRTGLGKAAKVGKLATHMTTGEIKGAAAKTLAVTKGALLGMRRSVRKGSDTQHSRPDTNPDDQVR